MSSGVTVGCGGPAGTELGQLCRAPYVPVHSTMGNLRVYPSPALPRPPPGASKAGEGPGEREHGKARARSSRHSWGRLPAMAILS